MGSLAGGGKWSEVRGGGGQARGGGCAGRLRPGWNKAGGAPQALPVGAGALNRGRFCEKYLPAFRCPKKMLTAQSRKTGQ